MGMFDELIPFADHFKENEAFDLQNAKVGPEISTDFGPSRPALLQINGKWYSVFGEGLVNQIERMESGDLPQTNVVLTRKETRSGQKVKLLVKADQAGSDDDIPF